MKKIYPALLLLLLVPSAAFGGFDRWFEEKTMRFDYFHAGDAYHEEFYFAQIKEEPYWGGSKTSLVDKKEYGLHIFKIADAESGEIIYSRGFSTLWDEWQSTEEARLIRKSMPESVVFPFPKNDVRIEIYTRDENGKFVKKFEQYISPSDYSIARYPLRYHTFDVAVNGNPEHSVDIVLLPEGYCEAEQEKFEEACRGFAEALFSFEPYSGLRHIFNIRAVWVPSFESGVTVPGDNVWKNTSAKAAFWTFGMERYQMVEDYHNLRDQAAHAPCDCIYVLSNTAKYGGGGIYNFYGISSANHPSSTAKVYIHEFGHLFAGLGDEYVGDVSYGGMYSAGVEPWEENLTTLAGFESKAWSRMLPAGMPVPTPEMPDSANRLGVYEGGGYAAEGVYRPWQNCLMNNLHTIDMFCPVCEKTIRDQIEFVCR